MTSPELERPEDPRKGTRIVIAAYQEAPTIGEVVASLRRDGWPILVVDDGSSDDTAARSAAAGAWVLRHPVNLGQGAALATGFTWALRDPATRFVVTFDADGQHDPQAVMRLIDPLLTGQVDVVLGSRFLSPGNAVNMPASRKALLHVATRLARWTTGLALTDTHNGMRAFNRLALGHLTLTQNRMAHASEIQAEIGRLGLRYCEVAVHVTYTPHSLAKGQRFLDGVSVLWDLIVAKVR